MIPRSVSSFASFASCYKGPFRFHQKLTFSSSRTRSENAFHKFLANNKQWHQKTSSDKPDLFPSCAKGQAPPVLWLGCSDSRVPETTLCNAQPGDIFVHRNIANIISPHDMSSQSVIFYAVNALKVKQIVVCGHTSCGGVAAALGQGKIGGTLDGWLMPIRELRSSLAAKGAFEGKDDKEQALTLVAANVQRGVDVVRKNPEVVKAQEERGLTVHGCIYDVGSGQLTELDTGEGHEDLKQRMEHFKVG
ncbi:MAG: hypothetical protein L6R37_001556 [Teloschistes peruensis]|nr:MAG: hypothetical protein L6R37_001556 [Teloschistes peruensis]